jgi:hypothetical protein
LSDGWVGDSSPPDDAPPLVAVKADLLAAGWAWMLTAPARRQVGDDRGIPGCGQPQRPGS